MASEDTTETEEIQSAISGASSLALAPLNPAPTPRMQIRQVEQLLELAANVLVDASFGKMSAPTRCRLDEQRVSIMTIRSRIRHIVQGTNLE